MYKFTKRFFTRELQLRENLAIDRTLDQRQVILILWRKQNEFISNRPRNNNTNLPSSLSYDAIKLLQHHFLILSLRFEADVSDFLIFFNPNDIAKRKNDLSAGKTTTIANTKKKFSFPRTRKTLMMLSKLTLQTVPKTTLNLELLRRTRNKFTIQTWLPA